jgi:hypothetical protein
MKAAAAWFAGLVLALGAHAAAEDKDVDLIPRAAPSAPAAPSATPANGTTRIFVENAFVATALRDDLLVPSPPPSPPRWEDRLFADARLEWPLGANAFVAYSGRLNLKVQEDLGFPNRGNVTHDWRELYVSAEPQPRAYVDAGRINVKSGVALGFNPTDFFKARAVVDPLTADPRALREDRLGALMLRGQRVGERVTFSAAYAPKVRDPAPVAIDPDRGFDPLFDRTNASNRWLVKASAQLGDGFNPEGLFYHDVNGSKLGVNLAESVGQSAVVYLEWAGGRRLGIVDEAFAFGRQTGTIPPSAPDVIGQGGEKRFRSQLAAGASYTTETRITFNLEYHYNGAGFSDSDWDRWFSIGQGRPASSPITRSLWFVRGYASDQQEPLQRHAVFARMDWVDFLVPKLELTGFALVDAQDGSALVQLQADYARSDTWSFGMLAAGTTGGRRSNFGSLPREASVLLRATRYF